MFLDKQVFIEIMVAFLFGGIFANLTLSRYSSDNFFTHFASLGADLIIFLWEILHFRLIKTMIRLMLYIKLSTPTTSA